MSFSLPINELQASCYHNRRPAASFGLTKRHWIGWGITPVDSAQAVEPDPAGSFVSFAALIRIDRSLDDRSVSHSLE